VEQLVEDGNVASVNAPRRVRHVRAKRRALLHQPARSGSLVLGAVQVAEQGGVESVGDALFLVADIFDELFHELKNATSGEIRH